MTLKFLLPAAFILLTTLSYATTKEPLTANDNEESQESIVPKKAWLTDAAAKKYYAKILALDPKQAPQALEIFKELYEEDKNDFSLRIDIERTSWFIKNLAKEKGNQTLVPRQSEMVDVVLDSKKAQASIVPKSAWLTDAAAKKYYAKILALDPKQALQALEIFKELYEEDKSDFSLRIDIERTSWFIENLAKEKGTQTLVSKQDEITDYTARLTLARILSLHRMTYAEAFAHYFKQLALTPHDTTLLLEIGLLYANENQFSEALAILQKLRVKGLAPSEKLAQYEERLGYASFSRAQFETLLQEGKVSKITYANSMLMWGEFYRAEAIYREALIEDPHSEKLQTQLIDTLIGSQRFDEAEELTLDYLQSCAKDVKPFIERLAAIKAHAQDYKAALEFIEELLAYAPQKEKYLLGKADLLYRLKRFEAALEVYQALKGGQDLFAQGYLGAGKCLLKLGLIEEATVNLLIAANDATTRIKALYFLAKENVLSPCFIEEIIASTKTAQELKIWGETYANDGISKPLASIYTAATKLDENYFPGHTELANAYLIERAYGPALAIHGQLIASFPDNLNLLIAQARAFSWNKEYVKSLDLYSDLITLNPKNPVPKLERARVAYWNKDFGLAKTYYEQLLVDTFSDSYGLQKIHEKVAIELKTITLQWNGRIFQTLALYEKQLALDPTNDTWKYEYAQALCSLGLCDYSMDIYRDILENSPLNTSAGMALERESLKNTVSLSLNGNYWQEKGYGELSQVGRYGLNSILAVPFSCRHRMRLIPRHYVEHTYYDNGYHAAEGITLEWERRFDAILSATAGATYKQYHQHFEDTLTGFYTLNFNIYSYFVASFGYSKLDEICNYFNLVQKTQKDVFFAAIESTLSHRLSINALAEGIRFSDRNSAAHCLLAANYAFSEFPTVFKVGLTGEYRNTTRVNIFTYGPTGQLLDITYPYWTPQRYFLGQVLFQLRYDYGWLEFCAAPQQFCDLKFALGTDSQKNPYWEIKGEWQHEVYSGCKIGATAYLHKSAQWDGKGFWFSCTRQF